MASSSFPTAIGTGADSPADRTHTRARLVHSHFALFDLDALHAARGTGAALIWHARNELFGYPLAQRLTDLVKARVLVRRADAVIAVSDRVRTDLRRRGFPRHNLRVTENAVALDHFAERRSERSLCDARWEFPKTPAGPTVPHRDLCPQSAAACRAYGTEQRQCLDESVMT